MLYWIPLNQLPLSLFPLYHIPVSGHTQFRYLYPLYISPFFWLYQILFYQIPLYHFPVLCCSIFCFIQFHYISDSYSVIADSLYQIPFLSESVIVDSLWPSGRGEGNMSKWGCTDAQALITCPSSSFSLALLLPPLLLVSHLKICVWKDGEMRAERKSLEYCQSKFLSTLSVH